MSRLPIPYPCVAERPDSPIAALEERRVRQRHAGPDPERWPFTRLREPCTFRHARYNQKHVRESNLPFWQRLEDS